MKTYRWLTYYVNQAEDTESPRNYADTEITALCIREHRRYTFPNDLDFDFDNFDDWWQSKEFEDLKVKYYIFTVDMYEHWGIVFSLSWDWMQCRFDTSSDCWFIAISKKYYSKEDARKVAKSELEEYNARANGYMMEWYVDYWAVQAWENEYFWPYVSEEEVEKECKNSIDIFLKDNKQYTQTIEYTIRKEVVMYGTSDELAKLSIKKNYELPTWYVEWSFKFS